MRVSTDFCGGNAQILNIDNNKVSFLPDLRDTDGDWFYWAFKVTGAAGKTVTFDMSPKNYVGPFGAAVSHDLSHWEWTGSKIGNGSGFSYTFADDEDCVYFAHDMLYHPSRFYRFCELHRLPLRIIADDNKGTPIPCLTLGEGKNTVILTARHHCCEATGDYIMEGILDEFVHNPIPNIKLIALPFIDADGVVAGDQGKNRRPHDHNRDYIDEPLYMGVRVVQELARREHPIAVFDLHSPWHTGGRNDKVFFVRGVPEMRERMVELANCFAGRITPDAMQYDIVNDIDPGVEWNNIDKHITCGSWASDIEGNIFGFSLETTYFGESGNVVSQSKLIETGRCFIRAFADYLAAHGVN